MPQRWIPLCIICGVGMLVAAGCCPVVPPLPQPPELETLFNWQGWVQVRVTNVPASGYVLQWGDASAPYGVSEVSTASDVYEHFYQAVSNGISGGQRAADYEIELTDPLGQAVARVEVTVLLSSCYVSLVGVDGCTITVKCWGRFGTGYSVSWGDRFADQVFMDDETATIVIHHTYAEAGTYPVGMRELVAPEQPFFAVSVQ